jgi:hypothetical protein
MRPSPKSLRDLKKDEQKEEIAAEEGFISLVRKQIESLLKMPFDPTVKDAVKERNISIANAIKFIMVCNKVSGGDDDGFWGDSD